MKDVRASVRLADSPSCIVSDEDEPSLQMQQMLRAMGQKDLPALKPTLEINPDHEISRRCWPAPDDVRSRRRRMAALDQALLMEGVPLKDPLLRPAPQPGPEPLHLTHVLAPDIRLLAGVVRQCDKREDRSVLSDRRIVFIHQRSPGLSGRGIAKARARLSSPDLVDIDWKLAVRQSVAEILVAVHSVAIEDTPVVENSSSEGRP